MLAREETSRSRGGSQWRRISGLAVARGGLLRFKSFCSAAMFSTQTLRRQPFVIASHVDVARVVNSLADAGRRTHLLNSWRSMGSD